MSEVKLEPFQCVLARDFEEDPWRPDIFLYYNKDNICWVYICAKHNWMCCIPYNEETKHLLGTTNSSTPPESEFKLGEHVEYIDNYGKWRKGIIVDNSPNKKNYCKVLSESKITIPVLIDDIRHADWLENICQKIM